jgi:hypothetical protein
VADVGVFVTRFREFFPVYEPGGAMTSQETSFELAVIARTAILVWCLVVWLREESPILVLGTGGWRSTARASPVVA